MSSLMFFKIAKLINLIHNSTNMYLVQGKKASNWAVVGELGRYPLYIDIIISMIKYWIHLHDNTSSPILRAAIDENYGVSE